MRGILSVKVLMPPDERKSIETTIDQNIYEEKATGEFVLVKFELVNESGETWDKLFTNDFLLLAQVDGETLTYRAKFDATNFATRNYGYANYLNIFYEETQPAVLFKAIVVFDASPYGVNRVFVFQPRFSGTQEIACTVHIPLE